MHHVIPDDPDDPEGECAERVRVRQNVQSFFVDLERVMVKALIVMQGATVLRLLGIPSPVTSILMDVAFGMGQQKTHHHSGCISPFKTVIVPVLQILCHFDVSV